MAVVAVSRNRMHRKHYFRGENSFLADYLQAEVETKDCKKAFRSKVSICISQWMGSIEKIHLGQIQFIYTSFKPLYYYYCLFIAIQTAKYWCRGLLAIDRARSYSCINQRDGIYRARIIYRNLWSQYSLAHFKTHKILTF